MLCMCTWCCFPSQRRWDLWATTSQWVPAERPSLFRHPSDMWGFFRCFQFCRDLSLGFVTLDILLFLCVLIHSPKFVVHYWEWVICQWVNESRSLFKQYKNVLCWVLQKFHFYHMIHRCPVPILLLGMWVSCCSYLCCFYCLSFVSELDNGCVCLPKPPGVEEDQVPVHWCFLRGLLWLQVPQKGTSIWQGVVHHLRHGVPQPHGIHCGGGVFLCCGSVLVLAATSPLRVSAQRPFTAQAPQERVVGCERILLVVRFLPGLRM